MDFRKIRKLIELLQKTGIAEIEINDGKETVRIQLDQRASVTHHPRIEPVTAAIKSIEQKESYPSPAKLAAQEPAPQQCTIHSAMIGRVYFSSSPEAKPYVEVGQTIKEGDIICQIVAMNLLNPIQADKSGKIIEILVDDGAAVEYHQPLLMLE